MDKLYREIRELENINGLSKHEQFVQGILNAIQKGVILKGDNLPSVNSLVNEFGFARETISKGYKDLIKRGIVESKNRIGFFVASDKVEQYLKIALVLFAFDTFQETFYKTFRAALGDEIQVDVFFHHNNIEIFDNIIRHVRGKYGRYVVAPIPNLKTPEILRTLPMDKFLMVDRFEVIKKEHSYVVQEFEQASYRIFMELLNSIRKFKKGFIYYHRPNADTPGEILRAFKKFVRSNKIKHEILPEYQAGTIEKGKVYYTINNVELWLMLKDCQTKGFTLGKDVGILSHNDDMIKEIICGGITTYSTDFKLMAEKAAAFILSGTWLQETIPTVLIKRNSL